MIQGKTEVETLKLNGWGLGDILEGDEGHGPDRIKIIALGIGQFICLWRNRDTGEFDRESSNTTLSCRDWHKVGHDRDYAVPRGCCGVTLPEGWEVLPVDLRTHLGDFREAVDLAISLGDPDEYWTHQLKTIDRVQEMMIDRAFQCPPTTTAFTVKASEAAE